MVIDPEGSCPDCGDPISSHDEHGCHWGGRDELCECWSPYPSPERIPPPPVSGVQSGFPSCGEANQAARVWAHVTGSRWRVTHHLETGWTATETDRRH